MTQHLIRNKMTKTFTTEGIDSYEETQNDKWETNQT